MSKKKAAAPPPVENPPVDEPEEQEEEPPPPERVKSTLLDLPRGPGRPVVGQVVSSLSESHLRKDLRRTFSDSELHPAKAHEKFRQTLQSELKGLVKQTKKRNEEEILRLQTEKFKEDSRLAHLNFLASTRLGTQKLPWTYCDPAGFFEPPLYEQEESKQCDRNQALCGIYNVQHPDFKPPHSEFDVYGGWTPHMTNIRNETLYEFKDKEWHGTPMSPNEKMIKERLERNILTMTALTKQDALDRTNGAKKKDLMLTRAPKYSSLKREQNPWVAQRVATHTYFETPKLSQPLDPYDDALEPYIVQPDRAMSFKKNIIASDPITNPKSFWSCPSGGLTGTNVRQVRSQELLHRNQRGCTDLKPGCGRGNRTMLLKGTGSMSFT
jgi:hypothetical protein